MLGIISFAAMTTGLWIWTWRVQSPKVLRAHEAALAEAEAEGGFRIGAAIYVKMADCVVQPASWLKTWIVPLPPLRLFPIRQQRIIWRDAETGVIAELALQTKADAKPGMCLISSTKAVGKDGKPSKAAA